MTHVYNADEMSEKRPKPDINKLTVLFNAIDTQNCKKISKEDSRISSLISNSPAISSRHWRRKPKKTKKGSVLLSKAR